jgi:hypothetical protein
VCCSFSGAGEKEKKEKIKEKNIEKTTTEK